MIEIAKKRLATIRESAREEVFYKNLALKIETDDEFVEDTRQSYLTYKSDLKVATKNPASGPRIEAEKLWSKHKSFEKYVQKELKTYMLSQIKAEAQSSKIDLRPDQEIINYYFYLFMFARKEFPKIEIRIFIDRTLPSVVRKSKI